MCTHDNYQIGCEDCADRIEREQEQLAIEFATREPEQPTTTVIEFGCGCKYTVFVADIDPEARYHEMTCGRCQMLEENLAFEKAYDEHMLALEELQAETEQEEQDRLSMEMDQHIEAQAIKGREMMHERYYDPRGD